MREILFRGKIKRTGEWIYGFYGENSGTGDAQIIKKSDCCYNIVIPETVGQYTGLCDKNGKKIFEGDIVKCKHDWQNQGRTLDTDEVAFLEQKIRGAYGKYIDKTLGEIFRWRYHYFRNYAVEYYVLNGGWRVRNGSCFHSLTQTYITNRDLEVIGNIHDNPELLRKEDEGK